MKREVFIKTGKRYIKKMCAIGFISWISGVYCTIHMLLPGKKILEILFTGHIQ
ncbi:hypothetical protein D3C85_1599850 [compost metagenome]